MARIMPREYTITVNTFSELFTLTNLSDNMNITCLDASGDVRTNGGTVVYTYLADKTGVDAFIVDAQEFEENVVIEQETLTITDGKVTMAYTPANGILLECKAMWIDNGINFIEDVIYNISGLDVIVDSYYNGKDLVVKYLRNESGKLVSTVVQDGLLHTHSNKNFLDSLSSFKTINNQEIVGSGNITISGASAGYGLNVDTNGALEVDTTLIATKEDISNFSSVGSSEDAVVADVNADYYLQKNTSHILKPFGGNNDPWNAFLPTDATTGDYVSVRVMDGYEATYFYHILVQASGSDKLYEMYAQGDGDDVESAGILLARGEWITFVKYGNGWRIASHKMFDERKFATKDEILNKVDKVDGKGLSTEDYTTEEKSKLAGLSAVASSGSYNDLTDKPLVPTKVSQLTNDSGFQTASDVSTAIEAIVGGAPGTLDTLKEIADQLANDESAVSSLVTTVSNKVDKVSGKGLSTEDYSTAEKSKLAGIEAGAQVNTITSVAGKTGVVTLAKGDVGLGNVDNTSDANKPISTATQSALDAKQDTLVSGTNIKTINGTSVLGSGNIVISGVGGSDSDFRENSKVISYDYTLGADKNASITGPIEVATGYSITISDGARLVIL